jgi:hypothetical protein
MSNDIVERLEGLLTTELGPDIAEAIEEIRRLRDDNAKASWVMPDGERTSLPPSTWQESFGHRLQYYPHNGRR